MQIYFEKRLINVHFRRFRVWLAESKDKRFGDLSEDEARSYFKKFVKLYNNGELSSRWVFPHKSLFSRRL